MDALARDDVLYDLGVTPDVSVLEADAMVAGNMTPRDSLSAASVVPTEPTSARESLLVALTDEQRRQLQQIRMMRQQEALAQKSNSLHRHRHNHSSSSYASSSVDSGGLAGLLRASSSSWFCCCCCESCIPNFSRVSASHTGGEAPPNSETSADLSLSPQPSSGVSTRSRHCCNRFRMWWWSVFFRAPSSSQEPSLLFGSSRHRCNVILMALCFSLVEAALLVVLSLETSVNETLGQYSSGSLYVSYTLAGLFAPAVVYVTGAKWGLVVGVGGYCLYIAGNIIPSWYTLIPTAIIAGFTASFLWTSQGSYITTSAKLHSEFLQQQQIHQHQQHQHQPQQHQRHHQHAPSYGGSDALSSSDDVSASDESILVRTSLYFPPTGPAGLANSDGGVIFLGASDGSAAAAETDGLRSTLDNNNNNNSNSSNNHETLSAPHQPPQSHVSVTASSLSESTTLGTFNGIFVGIFFSSIVLAQSGSSLFLGQGSFDSSDPPQSRVNLMFALFSIIAVAATVALAVLLPQLPLSEEHRKRFGTASAAPSSSSSRSGTVSRDRAAVVGYGSHAESHPQPSSYPFHNEVDGDDSAILRDRQTSAPPVLSVSDSSSPNAAVDGAAVDGDEKNSGNRAAARSLPSVAHRYVSLSRAGKENASLLSRSSSTSLVSNGAIDPINCKPHRHLTSSNNDDDDEAARSGSGINVNTNTTQVVVSTSNNTNNHNNNNDSNDSEQDELTPPISAIHLLLSSVMINTNPLMVLMIPSNMAFGFMQGFQYSTFASHFVKPSLGTANIGNIASISALGGALISLPFGWLSDRVGRQPIMALGCVVHSAMCFICLYSPTITNSDGGSAGDGPGEERGTSFQWGMLVCVAVLIGMGNSVWNAINSAVFGEFFAHQLRPAFANLKAWSGLATSIAFFAYPAMSVRAQLLLVLVFELVGFFAYLAADRLFRRKFAVQRDSKVGFVPQQDEDDVVAV